MKKRCSLLLILCSIFLHVGAQESRWSSEMYDIYSYYNYTDYSPFNQSIEQTNFDSDLLEAAIFYETNRQRAKYGLSILQFDYNIYVCAHNHSVDMVEYNFFSHTSVVQGKTSFSDRLTQVGYSNHVAAENIAYSAIKGTYRETARYLVEEVWMNSTGHRKNILTPDYTHLGCGAVFYYNDRYSSVYVKTTQNFLRKFNKF